MRKHRASWFFPPPTTMLRVPYLPPELYCAIFCHLELWDRIRVSHVCSLWRTVALDDASLWSTLRFKQPKALPLEALSELLRRTKEAAVSIGPLRVDNEARDVGRILVNHMRHIDSLDIFFSFPLSFTEPFAALQVAAPVLTSLNLRVEHRSTESLPDGLFAHHAPLLRNITLDNIGIPSNCPAVLRVSQAMISTPTHLATETVCLSDVMPLLTDIIITLRDWPAYTINAHNNIDSLTLLPECSDDALFTHLGLLHHANVFHMVLAFATVAAMRAVLADLEGVMTYLEVQYVPEGDEGGYITAEFRGEHGRMRRFTYVESSVFRTVITENALCTLNLETLECAQHLLYLFEGMPFPELLNLHLLYHRVRNPRQVMNDDVESSLPPALKWILRDECTPNLHTLFLSADRAADGTIVPVDSAAYVAALKRRLGTPKIRRLLIQRVILVGPSEELNTLTNAGHELFVDSDEGSDDWDESNGSDDVADV